MATDKDILIKKGLTLALKEAKVFQLSVQGLIKAFPDIIEKYDVQNLANENLKMIQEMCEDKRELFDEEHPAILEKLQQAHAMAIKDIQNIKTN